MKFILYSIKHTRPGHPFTFWGPDCRGYTQDVDSAGRYTADKAKEIVRDRSDTVEIPESKIERFHGRHIIDPEFGGNDAVLKELIEQASMRDLDHFIENAPAEPEDRKDVLLRAARDLLKKMETNGNSDALLTTAFYDEADCDACCLINDIEAELDIEDWDEPLKGEWAVAGDHSIFARPDKVFNSQTAAFLYAEELRERGFENVTINPPI